MPPRSARGYGRTTAPAQARLSAIGPVASSGRLRPSLPGLLVLSDRDLVAEPDERQAKQPDVSEESLHDGSLVGRQVRQALVPVCPSLGVEEPRGTEPLHEATELTRRDRLPAEVDEVDRPAPLLEKPDRGTCRRRILEPEDLNGRCGRCRH